MRKKSHSRFPADRRIAEILAAARAVVVERGHENAMLSEIAERAGIVEGTLYRFFDNKRDLLMRVAEDWAQEQLSGDSGLSAVQGTWNRLRHCIWRSLNIVRQHPSISRFVLTEIRASTNYRDTVFFDFNRRFTEEVRGIVREAIRNGEFRGDVSPVLVRDMIFGCIEHSTWVYLRKRGDFNIDELADGIANVVYCGMLAPPSPAAANPAGPLADAVHRLEQVAQRLEGLAGHVPAAAAQADPPA
ncbi:TetR/AcrR family transcriptional regulator [Hydrogenophaga sp.]|uniref:TetR/AcrR family transcriptional regulator n=1 Tax=Hydrogenophaga sp. TaxID=1904254 RepID=UPI002720F4CB|nr:TetR/AcrR family transcriptional regulator [Hydrogenophaga sp.]MDO9439075.1 TetR/AcrR family transcriptional regulator [Hydrogenophaga sp.]